MLRISSFLALVLLASTTAAPAQTLYDDEKIPEGWAWKQIRNGEIADFHERCGVLDPRTDVGWSDPCRQISPQFLIDVLTVSKWRDQVVRRRVRLRGVRIDGPLDLSNTEIGSEVWIEMSRIEGDMMLTDAHWSRPLSLRGSNIAGKFNAQRMHAESAIALHHHAAIENEVSLQDAKINGTLDMDSSTFGGAVNASGASVAGFLAMSDDAAFLGDVNLSAAKIGGNLIMSKSSFSNAVTGTSLKIEGSLFMRNNATFEGEVNLRRASIGGTLEMNSSSFLGAVDADAISVAGSIFMRDHANFHGDVSFRGAKIGDGFEIASSSYDRELIAQSLTVDHKYQFTTRRSPAN